MTEVDLIDVTIPIARWGYTNTADVGYVYDLMDKYPHADLTRAALYAWLVSSKTELKFARGPLDEKIRALLISDKNKGKIVNRDVVNAAIALATIDKADVLVVDYLTEVLGA